ncbi:hypothetical protein AGR4A_pAt10105 [Agrobacterium tumefaciens str. B6]|uniref:Uncharacterized protein n=1 Tax=Agrobacterium tumefaciens str. B6 TaxID=1183423 RepID=A0A822VA31_AGRTU|nr:hypothetical protein AGR4A_pAt10105 [Agrobacterium tumefaciens str. B6]
MPRFSLSLTDKTDFDPKLHNQNRAGAPGEDDGQAGLLRQTALAGAGSQAIGEVDEAGCLRSL